LCGNFEPVILQFSNEGEQNDQTNIGSSNRTENARAIKLGDSSGRSILDRKGPKGIPELYQQAVRSAHYLVGFTVARVDWERWNGTVGGMIDKGALVLGPFGDTRSPSELP
jgi:hypothetical protein